jgi:hypothetical protein
MVLDDQRGTLDAKFAVPPFPLGVNYLRIEIERIEAFAYFLETAKPDIPETEWTGLLD